MWNWISRSQMWPLPASLEGGRPPYPAEYRRGGGGAGEGVCLIRGPTRCNGVQPPAVRLCEMGNHFPCCEPLPHVNPPTTHTHPHTHPPAHTHTLSLALVCSQGQRQCFPLSLPSIRLCEYRNSISSEDITAFIVHKSCSRGRFPAFWSAGKRRRSQERADVGLD